MALVELEPTEGLYLEDTGSDGTEAMSTGASLLYDDDLTTPASPTNDYFYYHYAYGLDLGSEKEVSRIICFDHLNNDGWFSAGHDSVKVFKSNDNVTYILVEELNGPERIGGRWVLDLTTPVSGRYWKVFNCEASSTLAGPGGGSLKITEIEIYKETPAAQVSGTIMEQGSGGIRTVRAYIRSTGVLYSSGASNAFGYFSINAPDESTEMFVIAFDDDAGVAYNALIFDRVKGVAV